MKSILDDCTIDTMIHRRKALRHNEGKREMAYVLDFPKAMDELCKVMEYGAAKYEKDNWKKGGKPDDEYLSACMRHLYQHRNGNSVDPESDCRHIAHAAWNLLALLELNTN